jgi:phosphatidylserine synthase
MAALRCYIPYFDLSYRPFGYSLLFLAGLRGSRARFFCAVALAWSGVLLFLDFNSCHPPPPSLVYVIALLYHVILSSLMVEPANFMDWVGFDATVQWVQCKFFFILYSFVNLCTIISMHDV